MSYRNTHLVNAGLTLVLTILGAGILLPLVRVHPESVHGFFGRMNVVWRVGFTFFLCVLFTWVTFKLLVPRIGHLAHWKTHPPAWMAALLAWAVVAVVDIFGNFGTTGYRGTVLEWLVYAGGSLLTIGWYTGFVSEVVRRFSRTTPAQVDERETIKLHDIENAPWEEIELWLRSDAPAQYDLVGNKSVADRVSNLISSGTRSVGIVGPFGAGKTSIAEWIVTRLDKNEKLDSDKPVRRYFICQHNCWGFETSASAIHLTLESAVSNLSAEVDTFQVDSLPESYRRTFTAGGTWIDTISSLVLSKLDPMKQFARLSELLGQVGAQMVFIIEDLDRNDTRAFEIQEVLAFLERLKQYRNLSFILTGGLFSSQRIDYAKLCDHIEYLKTVPPKYSSQLIARVNERCVNSTDFQYVRLGDGELSHEWGELAGALMQEYEELSLSQAVASLLNTPRALRHALGRTFSAWRTLYGEIDFDHLLAVNILRFAAPECFLFLFRRWDRLRSHPSRQPTFGEDRINRIREAVLDDWNRTIQDVEWDPAAVLKVMTFILPASEYWLVDKTPRERPRNGPQQVCDERYWTRAVNEAIDEGDVRDQIVIRDTQAWIHAPAATGELVTQLTTSSLYSDIWEDLAGGFFAFQRDRILQLSEHVIDRILHDQGSSAWEESQGFGHTRQFASQRVPPSAENLLWFQARVSNAAAVSIDMVNALWHYYGNPGPQSILRPEDGQPARQHILNEIRANVPNGVALAARLSPITSATLYQLVFDPRTRGAGFLTGVQPWSWLGALIVDALLAQSILAAANCVVLLGGRVSARDHIDVDNEALDQLFGNQSRTVIQLLESMAEKLPEGDRILANNVVVAAKRYLDGSPPLGKS